MVKYRVLFICIHNSARSQMAEAFLNKFGNEIFEAESAGLEAAGKLNPYAVEVMQEIGIDISKNPTKSVLSMIKKNKQFDLVIIVCDAFSAASHPIIFGNIKSFAWPFSDPTKFTGTREEILAQTRIVRDEIKDKIIDFVKEY